MVRALLAELDAYQFSAAHLRAVTALCRGGDPSAAVDLPHGLTARRVYGDLVLGPRQEAAVLAVEAGCDLLLVCHGADNLAEAHAALVEAVDSGCIPVPW